MASSALLLLSLLSVAAARADLDHERDVKIVGGEQVDIRKVPWTAAITVYEEIFQCGGTVISENWVLSAAHCFGEIDARDITVRVGSNTHASGGQKHNVEQVINHDDFHRCQNDIALLKLSSPIVFDESVAIANLPTAGSPPPALNTKLLVSGWGRTSNSRTNAYLMAVEIDVVDFSGCQKQPDLTPNETLQFCAFTEGKDSCVGDSGGPFVDGNVLVGIVSCGSWECGTLPAVYTKVVYYLDWIKKNTGI